MRKARGVWLLWLLLLMGCQSAGTLGSAKPKLSLEEKGGKAGLVFTLSEGKPEDAAPPKVALAGTTPLSDQQVKEVLDRMPAFTAKPVVEDFAVRPRSLPRPRTGQTLESAFPAASEPRADAPMAKHLEVMRYAPQGEVPAAAQISVTFNQPMVALTSHADLTKKAVPVKLSPQVKGQWRWVGSRTLVFDPVGDHLPMATDYRVEIPAGTVSSGGQKLATALSWTFRTPTLNLVASQPQGTGHPLEPLISARFDQDIDQAAVLKTVRINGGQALRLATAEEIAAEGKEANPRELLFKATEKLKPATTYKVEIGPGSPAAEGPLKTAKVQGFQFATFEKFAVSTHGGGESYGEPGPSAPLIVSFNNPVDSKTFDPAMVKATPEIPKMRVQVRGSQIEIRGELHGRTHYTVSLNSALSDTFGQELGETKPLKFYVDPFEARLEAPSGALLTLDPKDPTHYDLRVTNIPRLRVVLRKVGPQDWTRYRQSDSDSSTPLPGKIVSETEVQTGASSDQRTDVSIDLTPALSQGKGMLILEIFRPQGKKWKNEVTQWLQATNIGVDVAHDLTTLQAFATSLDGRPLASVSLDLVGEKGEARGQVVTGPDGLARLPLPEKAAKTLVASKGEDRCLVSAEGRWGYGQWVKRDLDEEIRWFVVDDRAMYRPDETVSVKGWLRRRTHGPKGQLSSLGSKVKSLNWTLRDSQWNEVLKGKTAVSAEGSFDLQLKLPKTVNLGQTALEFRTEGGSEYTHAFSVQEFRRPEFEVTAHAQASAVVGESATATVEARYFAGGGLPSAPVEWTVSTSPGRFTPPGRDDFSFGEWTSWWQSLDEDFYPFTRRGENQTSFESKTDASGSHHLALKFLSVSPARPTVVHAQASVSDVNQQEWSATTSLLVHPSEYYVGLRSPRSFVKKGEPVEVEILACDLQGKVAPEVPVEVSFCKAEETLENGVPKPRQRDYQTRSIISTTAADKVSFIPHEGGEYTVKAVLADTKGRRNKSTLTVWVAGEDAAPALTAEEGKLTLVPSRKQYKAGETAEILVQAPFAPAEGVVTYRREGLLKTERISLDTASAVLKVPIEDAYVPNLGVQVDLVGGIDLGAGKTRPTFASGSVDLSVPPLARTLKVDIKPLHPAEDPGAKTSVEVAVLDVSGQPLANAEVAVMAVDESVLALTGAPVPDPIGALYERYSSGVRDNRSRESLILARLSEAEKAVFESRLDERVRSLDNVSWYGETSRLDNRGLASATPYMNYDSLLGTIGGLRYNDSHGFDLFDGDSVRINGEFGHSQYYPEGNLASHVMGTTGVDDGGLDSLEGYWNGRALSNGTGYTARGLLGLGIRVGDDIDAGSDFSASSSQGDGPPRPRFSGSVKMRTNFNPTALFAPRVRTDAKGHAVVPFKLPDNLTRYRLVALATDGDKQFGKGESALTARLPLMVRPSPPRFLNFGDAFELPVVLQNQTDQPMDVQVAARTSNLKLTKAQGYSLTIPANDRVEVRFPATTERAGVANLQVGAIGPSSADAAETSLPVWTPATSEAFATYGELPSGNGNAKLDAVVSQAIQPPSDVFPQFGGLEITTSSTAVQSLTDAFVHLLSSKYDCAEEVSSRVLGVAALRDVLWAFQAPGVPSAPVLKAAVQSDLERLANLQRSDGGFGFWTESPDEWPYLSVHVAHALARAQEKGYTVPSELMARSKACIDNIKAHIPSDYSLQDRQAITAYAIYVRARLGENVTGAAQSLIADAGGIKKLSLESLGWLYYAICKDPKASTMTAAIRQHLNNVAVETGDTANFTTNYGDDDGYLVLGSGRRTDGILLEAMIHDQPDNDLIPKVARGLLAHRDKGRWGSTQDDAFVLLALDLYFRTYEKTTPDFVARAWLGDEFVAEHAYHGRRAEGQRTRIPMSFLQARGAQPLTLAKQGKGRLYYRLGMDYAPTSLRQEPAEHGFTVQRLYEPIDKPEDVRRDEKGIWHIKAGAKVRVKLTMVAPSRRYHVALTDPLPAGLEPLNPALANTGEVAPKPEKTSDRWWSWYGAWYEHQNLRDDRAEAFASSLWEGVHNYSYIARATTPGQFIAPATKAEEMYSPETFGRGASDVVVVE